VVQIENFAEYLSVVENNIREFSGDSVFIFIFAS